jgi:hypothetical protein
MHRFFAISAFCGLVLSFAALGAGGGQRSSAAQKGNGASSSSQKGNGANTSKGSPQIPGGNTTKTPGKQTKQQTGNQGATFTPQNTNLPARKPPKMLPRVTTERIANNPRVSPAAQGALNSVLAGNFLDGTGRQELNNLIAGNPVGLNEDELKAVQAVLDYDALVKREERYLQIENASGERVTLWLHYQTLADKDEWEWVPVKPVNAEEALRFVLEPDSSAYLSDGKLRIAAGRARLWAESESGYKWTSYRDEDLRLKPTTDRKDVREMETYKLRLVGPESTQARK